MGQSINHTVYIAILPLIGWEGGTRFFELVANRIETTCKIVFNAQENSILALKLIIVTQQEVVSFSYAAVI